MRVYVTKWAMTRGVFLSEEGKITEDACFFETCTRLPLRPSEFALDVGIAREQFENMKARAILSAEKKLNRLRNAKFEVEG